MGGTTLTYDAENRQVKATNSSLIGPGTETYSYDGDGRRVQKSGPAGMTTFVYDAFGQLAAEYGTAPASPCQTCYLAADHLGSTRLVLNENGAVVARHDYLPFGEEIEASSAGRNSQWGAGTDSVNQKFTGKERDGETGLDYFGARYYSSTLGRYTSPDWSPKPEAIPYADLSNPQTLNLYSYTNNSPLSNKDEDGHCTVDGENHGRLWCAAHSIGLVQTQKEQADYDRGALSQMQGFTIGGQSPADIAKNGTNAQVIAAYGKASRFLYAAAQQSLNPCSSGMECGVVALPGEGTLKPVNLPAWKAIGIDMDEVISGHTAGGVRASQSAAAGVGKDLFPQWMSDGEIESTIRQAYRNGEKIKTQGDRVLVRGAANGLTVEMWVNKATKTIETAYPKW